MNQIRFIFKMLKHLVLLSTVLVSFLRCETQKENLEQSEVPYALQELKLDSIKSIITIILDNGESLQDSRSRIFSGIIKKDENDSVRSVNFFVEQLFIDSVNYSFAIDLINLESWDSMKQNTLHIDSAFVLSNFTHLALSSVTIGDVSNELLFPIRIEKDSSKIYFEGKTTLVIKDWGFEFPESNKLHLGLSLFSLSEK